MDPLSFFRLSSGLNGKVMMVWTNKIYEMKKGLTASDPETSASFDDKQLEAWKASCSAFLRLKTSHNGLFSREKDLVCDGYNFKVEAIGTTSAGVLQDPGAWGKILALAGKK